MGILTELSIRQVFKACRRLYHNEDTPPVPGGERLRRGLSPPSSSRAERGGNGRTRWSSRSRDDRWLQVDLGAISTTRQLRSMAPPAAAASGTWRGTPA